MITGRSLIEIDANDLLRAMTRIYEIAEDEALFAIFGMETSRGTTRRASASVTSRQPLTAEDIEHNPARGRYGVDNTALLNDLCARGEIAPGEYVIRLS